MATLTKPNKPALRVMPSGAVEPRGRTWWPALVMFTAIAAALALLLPRGGYRPMWDGFVYAAEINDAASVPFSFGALRLAGHASQAYAMVAIGVQRLAPGSTWPLFLLGLALLGIAVAGFVRLVSHVLPGRELALERALVTAAFVLQPTMLAAVVQPGLDLPLIPAFIWAAALLLERRYAWVIALGSARRLGCCSMARSSRATWCGSSFEHQVRSANDSSMAFASHRS